MKLAVASDHAGYELKENIKKYLESAGYTVIDCGTASSEARVDYPDFGFKAAEKVSKNDAERGILVCGTGIGMSIAANKVEGIRAALCHDHFTAVMSRRHNNSNILVMGARVLGGDVAMDIVKAWLEEPYEGGRHETRLEKISAYEKAKSSNRNAAG